MITKQEIEAQKTANGGWTKAQLAQWGVPWPPPTGWKQKIIKGEIVPPRPSKSKTKMRKEAAQVAGYNRSAMCRIGFNIGIKHAERMKSDKIADFVISQFNLEISGKHRSAEVVNWARFTSPSLLADTRPQKRVRDETMAKVRNVPEGDRPASLRPSNEMKTAFYASWEWRTLRKEVLNQYGARCQCCGATPADVDIGGKPVRIVVDHIKPLARYWSLRLDRGNCQILCDECNMGAGAWDETDHRPAQK